MTRSTCLTLLIAWAPALAFAQQDAPPPPPPPDAAVAEGQPPPEPPPSEVPPPPPPPAQGPQAAAPPPAPAAPAPAAAGQWVHTEQYGWLWIPYAQQYTYIPSDPQVFPDQYVYYPVYGWRWVVAPWVYGYGPSPYWGGPGLRFFVWYSHPWFRVGGYWGWGGYRGWGAYRGWVGPRSWGAHGWARAPAYYRSGVGGPHPYAFRPAPARRAVERGRVREEHRR